MKKLPYSGVIQSLVAASFLLTLAGCSTMPISRKAEVKAIDKIAIVSLSVNERIYNAKGGPQSDANYKDLKKKAEQRKEYTGMTTDTTVDTTKEILSSTSKIYMDALKQIPNLDLIPIEKVKDMPAYQKAAGEPVDEKHFIPTLAYPGSKYFNPFRNYKYYEKQNMKTQQALTELCQQLNVDAVVVLRTKLGYEPVGMQLLGGLGGLLAKQKTKAKPAVGTGITVMTKAGVRAIHTVTEMKYIGKEVPMLQAGLVNFTGDEGVVVKAYEEAIAASAQALVDKINKELAAK